MQDNQDNLNTAETPNEASPAPKKPRKWLTCAFNIASGMAVSLAVKTLVVTCAATIAAPTATVFIGAAAAGLATSYLRHTLENYQLGKAGEEKVKFTFKKAAMGAGFGMLGAGIIQGLDHFAPDLVSNAISSIKNFFGFGPAACIEAPAAPVAPVLDIAPAPVDAATTTPGATVLPETIISVPEPTSIDCAKLLAENPAVSDRVHDAIERTAATNPKTSAQAMKDLGFFLYNGLDGMPKDPCLAVKLLREAAELGNVQAQVDLAFIEYHGNAAAGVAANPVAALEKMQGIKTGAARQLVEQWTGTSSVVEHAAPKAAAVVTSSVAAPAVTVAPSAPLETVTIQPSQPVVTVDVTTPDAPTTTTAFTEASSASGATVEVGQGSGSALRVESGSASGMDCKPVINVGDGNDIEFVCTMPANDDTFSVGERVVIQRPGLLNLVR